MSETRCSHFRGSSPHALQGASFLSDQRIPNEGLPLVSQVIRAVLARSRMAADVLHAGRLKESRCTMSQVAIQKVDASDKRLPVFDEIAKRFEAVRQRAFEYFEERGAQLGHELDDWLRAEKELVGWSAAELTEKDGAYDVQVALPGFDAKQVEVTATPNEIIVRAATEEEKISKKENIVWTELGSSRVYRRIELGAAIDVNRTTASLDKGLLRIHAPQAGAQQQIAVKAAQA